MWFYRILKQRAVGEIAMAKSFTMYVFFQAVNLSYQDLGHPYQKKEFQRVLRRLIRCEHIQLIENSLTDLSSILLPRFV